MQLFKTIIFVVVTVGVAKAELKESKRKGDSKSLPPSCDSKIYCQGELLHTVQMAALFNDSKHFVDMTMLDDEENILQNFETFMARTGRKPNKKQVSTNKYAIIIRLDT